MVAGGAGEPFGFDGDVWFEGRVEVEQNTPVCEVRECDKWERLPSGEV